MSDAHSVQQQLETKKNEISTLKYTKISALPEDIAALVRELQKVQETFRAASKMSNIGSDAFSSALNDVIVKLQKASQRIGNIKL